MDVVVDSFADKTIGEMIDHAYTLHVELKRAERAAKKAEEEYKRVLALLAVRVPDAGLSGASGSVARLGIQKKEFYSIQDAKALHSFILETGRVELLQKRVNSGCVDDLLETGVTVPGVTKMVTKTWVVKKL